MLAIISPAKKLDFEPLLEPLGYSDPTFPMDTLELVEAARTLSLNSLKRLMKLSDNLADLNYQRFKAFANTPEIDDVKQAIMAFAGDTYVGLDAANLDNDDLVYAQDHLRIISGLYGLLRPLDMIQPYRLEMGSRLNNSRGSDLYSFWGDRLSNALDDIVAKHKFQVLINLASDEYFKATKSKSMKARIIKPVFKEIKNGETRVIGMFAKRARGSMARYVIQNRIEDPNLLKNFDKGGYMFRDELSSADTLVYTREQPPAIS